MEKTKDQLWSISLRSQDLPQRQQRGFKKKKKWENLVLQHPYCMNTACSNSRKG